MTWINIVISRPLQCISVRIACLISVLFIADYFGTLYFTIVNEGVDVNIVTSWPKTGLPAFA